MSLFRRPKKQVRTRVVTIDPDADDNEMDDLPAPPPPPKLSFNYDIEDDVKVFPQQISSNEGGSKISKNNTLLSFDEDIDDENEGEVFKVKKSSFSRRLIKQRDREKKDDKVNIKIEGDMVSQTKKKDQIRILNGREAEAVHFQSEDEEDDEEDEDNGTQYFDDSDHKFRRPGHNNSKASNEAVRRALENGVIPDAHMIHEARKRRQLARDNTLGTEFIPFSNEKKSTSKEKSRLVREEDGHEAEEDEEEERLDFSKATNPNKWDAEKRREVFNAAEDEIRDRFSEGDSDPEMEAWERQQIRKGVSQSKMHNVAKEAYYETFNESKQVKNTKQSQQYSYYPTQPSFQGNVKTEVNRASLQQNNNFNLQDIVNGKTIVSPVSILKQLEERLEKLKLYRERDTGALSRLTVDIKLADEEVAEGEKIKPELSNRFDLYQNLRGYVSDLVDMLRYKMRSIESIENRLIDLMKARRDRLAQRRRHDVEDHLSEVKALNNLYSESSATFTQPPPDKNKTRRAAEREGRRTRRRRQRELKNIKGHKDGLSSDDEEMEFEISTYKAQRESILREASLLFEDVHDDFASLKGILSRFEDWRIEDFDAYSESYAFMCIPKLIAPLIRLYLIEWDFLFEYIDLTKFGWMKSLLSFTAHENTKASIESLSTDPDVRLIPSIAEKTIVPYISKVINASWDPVSTSQTRNLQKVVNYLIQEISVGPNSKTMHQLLTSIVAKFKESIDKDIYMPIFSTTELANKCSPANIFFSRQFWSAVKLLDNMSAWTGLLSDRVLQTLALDWLLTRYILIGIRNCFDLSESAQRAKGVLNVLPRIWLSRDQDSELPNGLQQLVRCLVSIVQNADISSSTYRISIPEISIILKSLGANKEAELILRKYS